MQMEENSAAEHHKTERRKSIDIAKQLADEASSDFAAPAEEEDLANAKRCVQRLFWQRAERSRRYQSMSWLRKKVLGFAGLVLNRQRKWQGMNLPGECRRSRYR